MEGGGVGWQEGGFGGGGKRVGRGQGGEGNRKVGVRGDRTGRGDRIVQGKQEGRGAGGIGGGKCYRQWGKRDAWEGRSAEEGQGDQTQAVGTMRTG